MTGSQKGAELVQTDDSPREARHGPAVERERRGRAGQPTRRHVGVLLDLNPATLRNWVEEAERAELQGCQSGAGAVVR